MTPAGLKNMAGPLKIAGLLNIAKPAGLTSRRVVDRVLALVAPAKVGHAGTLDPMATGVLVVCVGSATRLITLVQEQRKTYRAEFLLGRRSDTDDVTGAVVEVADPVIPSREALSAAAARFVGTISQIPPQFSAVHVAGGRAYDHARRGRAVELAPRPVEVHRLEILAYEWPRLEVDIECGSGTYIRSIGRDLGDALGCGAVMSALVRTSIGSFRLDDAVEFDALNEQTLRAALRPMAEAVAHLPRAAVSDEEIEGICQGRAVEGRPTVPLATGASVACFSDSDALICVAEAGRDGRLHPKIVFKD